MNWIFSRLPDETVKFTSACRRKFGNHMNELGDAKLFRLKVNRTKPLTLAVNFSAKRFADTGFIPARLA